MQGKADFTHMVMANQAKSTHTPSDDAQHDSEHASSHVRSNIDFDPACRNRHNVVNWYFFSELLDTVGEWQATQWLIDSQDQDCGKSVCSESSRSSMCSHGTFSSFSTSSTCCASTSSTGSNYISHSHRMRDVKPHYASSSTTGALPGGVRMDTSSQDLISGNATSFVHPVETSKISDMGANAGLLFTDAAHLVLGHIVTE